MKKYLFALFALLVCSFNADATLGLLGGVVNGSGVVTLDSYGGVTNVSCTNPNGTKWFGLTTVGSYKVLCDAAGHPYFGRGFYVFDPNYSTNDEAGGNYSSYITAKYGSTNTEQTWVTEEVARIKAWGFNLIGPYETFYATPPKTSNAKTPIIYGVDTCDGSTFNQYGLGTGYVKDLLSVSSPNWMGWGPALIADYEDANWANFVHGAFNSGANDYNYVNTLANASASDKAYLVGFVGCDSDYTHGFNAGPDFETSNTAGQADFRLSYLVALGSPVEWASTRQNKIYTDSTVYSKKTFHDQLTAEYVNISALNTAWGSSYTTFGTSGTCYGSHFAAWICPSPSAALAVGTGDGTTLTFTSTLNTTDSPNSVGIFVAGTLVGGDSGAGTQVGVTSGQIYGPNLSGTINYTTGALSITFTAGNSPASGAAITAEYITNGWDAGGTGVMDEDGRSGHVSWVGANAYCIDGVGDTTNCSPHGTSYASSGMVSDLNTLDTTLAAHYAQTYQTQINAVFPGALFLGNNTCGTWNVPPNRYVLAGFAQYASACIMSLDAGGVASGISQAKLDWVHTYAGDLALGDGLYNTVNPDSPYAWPNSSCTHSGTSVTCTIATPQNFSGTTIGTYCTDSTYNVGDIYPSVGTNTLTYTASMTPVNSSTTCNVVQMTTAAFTTQTGRESAAANQMTSTQAMAYTADGIHPFILDLWWQFADNQSERGNWGMVDLRDNAYDGAETTTATVACQPPLQAYNCGGELRSGWGSDNGLSYLINANTAIDAAVAAY